MEKEIKVRKKRFVAFWVTVAVVYCFLPPTVVSAANQYAVADSLKNQTVNANDTITHTGNTCSVTYWGYDAETDSVDANVASGIINPGEKYTVLDYNGAAPTGMKFSCWLVSDVFISGDQSAAINLTAQFVKATYTITFVSDGDKIASITQNYDTAITAPTNPSKTGYSFDGWDVDIPEKMPANDMTITAKWTVNQYTITFDTDGGTTMDPIEQDYGTPITPPNKPTRGNDYFMGWDPAIPDTMPAENLTIKAKWTPYVIEAAGTYDLKQGVEYKLGSVTQVSGDSSTYVNGRTFYVPEDGSYTFS